MYKEKRPSRSEFVPIRGLSYHVRIWEPAGAYANATQPAVPRAAEDNPASEATSMLPPLVLVHGWMDVAASYQFMVDALSDAFMQGRTVIAPDWRGFGETGSGGRFSAGPPQGKSAPPGGSEEGEGTSVGATDCYWFADYMADLDFLLDHYAGEGAVDLVGHSMGGNVAMLYAGVRPERIRRLVNLEGFGLPASRASQAPGRYAKWMDELKTLHRGELALKTYDDVDGVARRLMKTNPRLSPDKAGWLAAHWARPDAAGQWKILGEPAHKISSAQLYRLDEVLEIHQRITAPTLAVEASDDSLATWWQGKYSLAEYHERLKQIPDARVAVVKDAGHMLHHDQPEQLASLIENFLI